ncbi:hypothetical protein BJX68DRAFT_273200 [Aspergillus pseudodeflectus]|uniref:Uncharacterized protein n=1 Tax=Aspergillus pseudodeflectus TaxID=176178 RepID=A0ABR4JAS3_9EURO
MKSSILAATMTALAALSAATPTAIEAESRQFQVSVTFYGENDQSYSLLVPADRTVVHIGTYNPLIVHRVTSPGGGFCTFVGVEGESVVIYAEDEKVLSVPQVMSWGSCGNN